MDIREALNDYQARTGDAPLNGGAFGLTAALPCGPANIKFLDIDYLGRVLNGMHLMTFDFHSEKAGLTGANSPLYDQEWDIIERLSVDGCVKNYVEGGAGIHSEKISIGIPFYGSSYSFATELGGYHSNTGGRRGGKVDQVNWPRDLGTPVFYNILEKFTMGRDLITRRHEPTKTQYAYFGDGSGLVSYDDPQSVCDKVDYVNKNFLAGVFVWELSGDLTANLETPLLDAINRKLEEISFDCRLIATPDDGSVVTLPPEKPKGPAQYEIGGTDLNGNPIDNVVDAIFDHIQRAENGELDSVGAGYGHFSRNVLRHRTYDGSFFPSYNYRYDQFIDALRRMATEGINESFFYLGKDQNGQDDGDEAVTAFDVQEDLKKPLRTSYVYGLVNIAAFLAQAMVDSIIHDSCDELNIEYLPADQTDGVGFDDGKDQFRFPLANACGQNGRSYQDEGCPIRRDKNLYDCATQLNSEQIFEMESQGISRGLWRGAPKAFFCGPTNIQGVNVGFWDAMVGIEERDSDIPISSSSGRNDVEACCWWGRGSLKIRGTCLYGKLNHFIGKKAATDGRPAWFPDIDLCLEPGQICAGPASPALRWITGLYHWMENIQIYSEEDGNYKEQLFSYVNGNLNNEDFFNFATKLYVLNCVGESCGDRVVTDIDDRLRAFETVLNIFNIQFGSHAVAAPPFVVFPGQISPVKPTPAPTPALTDIGLPDVTIETVYRQVKVYLTGVEPDRNMTNEEQLIFENLMFDLLVPRLATVDVGIVEAIIESQNPNPEFEVDSPFASQAELGFGEEKPAVLEILMNVTLTFSEYPPGWRDWSIYVKSWIESFGNTLVEIFTSPKHPQHPITKSKFWDGLEDVSATNVPLPNTDPTYQPTIAPTYIIYPEPPKSNLYFMLGGIFAGLGAVCGCIGFFTYKFRQHKRLMEEAKEKRLRMLEELEREYAPPKATFNSLLSSFKSSLREKNDSDGTDGSDDSESSSSSSSSSSSDSDISFDNGEMPLTDEEDESMAPSFDEEPSAAQSYGEGPSAAGSFSNATSNQGSEYDEISDSQSRDVSKAHESLEMSQTSLTMSKDHSHLSSHVSSQISIPDDDYDELVERVLENDPSLKEILLDNKKEIGYDGGEALWSALADNKCVEQLSLRNCNIHDEEIEALSAALMDNTSITHLWLGDNAITSEGADFLIEALESNETIQMLDLFGNPGIDDEVHDEIREIMEERGSNYRSGISEALSLAGDLIRRVRFNDPALINLNLRAMEIGLRNDVFALFDALAENTHIQKVDLSLNELDDECIESLSLALVDNQKIHYLNLADNAITSEGAEYLLGTLESNDVLRDIDLEGNAIDDDVIDDVYDILDQRAPLSTTASVAQTSHGDISLGDIVDRMFSDDPKLVELSLDGMNLIDNEEFDSMVDALTTNEKVTKLSLNDTGINDDALASLCMALSENKSISYISLRDNDITDEGCEYLLGCLETNSTIDYVDLSGNNVGDELIEEVNAFLAPRPSRSVAESVGTSVSGRSSVYDKSYATGKSGVTSASGRSGASSFESGAISVSGRSGAKSYATGKSGVTSASGRSGAKSFATGKSGVTSASGRSDPKSYATGRSGVTSVSGRSDASSYESGAISVSGRSGAESAAYRRSGVTSASGRSGMSSFKSGVTSASGRSEASSYISDAASSYESSAISASGRSGAESAAYRSVVTSASGRSGVSSYRSVVTSASGRSSLSGRSGASTSSASGRSAETSISLIVDRIKSNDPSFVELDLDGTDLTNYDERESMVDALGGNDVIKSLNFNDTGIDDDIVAALSLALADNITITHISLRDNQITNEGCEYLLGTLDQNTTLVHIDLSGNEIDNDLLEEINAINKSRGGRVGVIAGKPPMHEVPEESDAVVSKRKAIMKVMDETSLPWPEKNKRILELQKKHYEPADANEEVPISRQEGNEDINVLVEKVINDDKNLQEIILDDQNVGEGTLLDMIDALAENTHVKYLSLRNMKIANNVAERIADALKDNTSVIEINLEGNRVTSNAAKKFLGILRDHNDTLEYLELADNQVRSGLISQLNKMLEGRRAKYTEEIEQSESDSESRQSSESNYVSTDDDSSGQSSAQSSAYTDDESMSRQSSAAKSKGIARSSRQSEYSEPDDDDSRSKQSTIGSRSRRSNQSGYSGIRSNDDGSKSKQSSKSRYSRYSGDGSRSRHSGESTIGSRSRRSTIGSRSRGSGSRGSTIGSRSRGSGSRRSTIGSGSRGSTIGSRSRQSNRSRNSGAQGTEDGSRSRRSRRSGADSEQSGRSSNNNETEPESSKKKKSVMSRFKFGRK